MEGIYRTSICTLFVPLILTFLPAISFKYKKVTKSWQERIDHTCILQTEQQNAGVEIRAGERAALFRSSLELFRTLMQLASKSGIGKSTLNNIENGKVSPTLFQLEMIAIAMNVKITDLFDSEYK